VFVAASTHCFSDKPLPEACDAIADLGFDRFEIWVSEAPHALSPSTIEADPEKTCAQLREFTRMTPVAVHLDLDVELPQFGSVSKLAKNLRVAQITVPASPQGTPFNTEIDRLRALVATGNKDGIRVSIKTEAGTLAADPESAIEFCQAVKGLGLTFDPSCYLMQGVKPEVLDRMAPYIFHTHLRDTSPTEAQVPVGLGEVDYSRLISLLLRESYQRALSIDLLPAYHTKIDRALEMRKLRLLLESLL
jgi:sugar phosphate isomerase/epimerase